MTKPSQWQDPLDLLEDSETLPVELFLTFRVNQLSGAFERQWSRFIRNQAGISLSEWRIMAILDSGPKTFARIVEQTEINKALVHRSAKALSQLDLVNITDTPGDARSTTLVLTSRGQALIQKIQPQALVRQMHFLRVLTAQERYILYSVMQKLRAAAKDWDLSLKA